MRATRRYRYKRTYPDGAVLEMVVWRLPQRSADRPHGLKYRLHYGSADGRVTIRYDNETGKGDHRHDGNHEERYVFVDYRTLIRDFLNDVARARRQP